MDWSSRKVLFWRLSSPLEADFCVAALREALAKFEVPEIFDTDQRGQFSSVEFAEVLKQAGIAISTDGKGLGMENVMIERLWRSVKYECVYLHAFETGSEAKAGIGKWITFYKQQGPHSSVDDQTPDEACSRNIGAGSRAPVGPQAAA